MTYESKAPDGQIAAAASEASLATARQALPSHAPEFSRGYFTGRQPFALPAPRESPGGAHRGLQRLLRGRPDPRQALGPAKVSDQPALRKASQRLL